jgi:hypothetical protein
MTKLDQVWWNTTVMPATLKVEIKCQPKEKVSETHMATNKPGMVVMYVVVIPAIQEV